MIALKSAKICREIARGCGVHIDRAKVAARGQDSPQAPSANTLGRILNPEATSAVFHENWRYRCCIEDGRLVPPIASANTITVIAAINVGDVCGERIEIDCVANGRVACDRESIGRIGNRGPGESAAAGAGASGDSVVAYADVGKRNVVATIVPKLHPYLSAAWSAAGDYVVSKIDMLG